jgi:hypothetical protein
MSYAEWLERGKDIVREHRRIKRGPAPAPTPTGPPPEQVAAEWEVLKESVRGEVEAELAMLDVIGAPVLPPLTDDEVLAWS